MFCQSQAFPIIKIARLCLAFHISKKAKCVEKSQNFKTWLQESQIGNPAVL